MNNRVKFSYQTWLPLLIAFFTAFGMLVGYRLADTGSHNGSRFIQSFDAEVSQIGRIEELLRLIDARYVDEIDEELLLDAATNAIINELDPHSVYITPDEIASVKETMSGYYKGIGIETILYRDTLRVTKVMEKSPAALSGLEFGDAIISSNDSILAGQNMPIKKQWSFLKAQQDEVLNLKVLHLDKSEEVIEVQPENILYPNVEYYWIDDIAYINISKFSDNTYEGLVKALEFFQTNLIIEELIIDLRDNPGGYLPEATKILNQLFVEDKRLLVFTKDRNDRKSEFNTTGRPFYKVEKLAVLINENSASASEIIAGAVQDWDKAIIVGEQSYGKGLVQEQYDLSNGGALRLTIARYFTPTGRYIQTPFDTDKEVDSTQYSTKLLNRPIIAQGGITPDILVNWSEDQKKIRKIVQQSVVSKAFELIISNHLFAADSVNLDLYQKDINDLVVRAYSDQNLEISDSSLEIGESMLKYEIYQQLGMSAKAIEIIASSDVFIQQATQSLQKENIFADFFEIEN